MSSSPAALRPVLVTDDRLWDDLVDRSPAGEIFHTSGWLRFLERSGSVRAMRLGLLRGTLLVAGIPILVSRFGPFLLGGSPLSNVGTPQMGPLLTDDASFAELMPALDHLQRRAHIAFMEIISTGPDDAQAYRRYGYQIRPALTLCLDLAGKSADAVWRGFEGRCRTAIRKAQAAGVTVEEAAEPALLETYSELVLDVFARQQRLPPFPVNRYQQLWNAFQPAGVARLLLARSGDTIVAGAIVLRYGGRMYYLDGASNEEGNRLAANNLIQWHALQAAVQDDITLYDMAGAGIPSIARFKSSFGSVLVERPHAFRTNSRLAAVALSAWMRYKPALRRAVFTARRAGAVMTLSH